MELRVIFDGFLMELMELRVILGPYKQASPRNRDFVKIPKKILKIPTASISRFNFK